MCAINGFYNFKNDADAFSVVKNMCESMKYRGPDDMDFYHDETIALGQNRLSIIGVVNGHQPIYNENESMLIICNGEIYNYKELKEELIKKGHVFSTESDTEVILHSYEEKGIDCLNDFRGMFAFAIYNKNSKDLFIAKDINGKKPLYYSITPKGFAFSSELTAIKNYFLTEYDVDWNEVKNYLKFSYSQSMSETYIKQIKKLENASYMLITPNSIKQNRYWKKKNTYSYKKSYEDAKKEWLNLLKESVALRLRSDVPVAILLSGGVDSSLIATLAKECIDEVHVITAGYKNTGGGYFECDEREIAKRFAKEKGLIWHSIELDENDYESYFYEYINYIDEPVSDLASIAKWGIYKKAKDLGFKVLLSGDGSDELFYGYGTHNKVGKQLQAICNYSNCKGIKKKMLEVAKNIPCFLDILLRGDLLHHYRNFYYPGYAELSEELDIASNDFEFENMRSKFYDDEEKGLDKVYSYLFNIWLTNNCYYLADKLAMGNSIENRCPFADVKLIEFVSSLPMEYKFKNSKAKGFLKDVAKDILPDYILNPAKKGFTPPAASFNSLFQNYSNKFFNKKLNYYNQLVVDYFLGEKL